MNSISFPLSVNSLQQPIGEAYLRLQLEDQIQAVVPMAQTQEVMVIPLERITPIPNMPEWVLGWLNQRSRVFWAIDLPQLLGFSPLDRQGQTYHIALIRIGKKSMALAMQKIQGVIRLPEETIELPGETVPFGIAPYLRGYIRHPTEGRLLVLDTQAILNCE